MNTLRRVLAVVAFVAIFAFAWRFASENGTRVDLYLGFATIPAAPLGMVVAVSFGAGAALAGLLMLYSYIRAQLMVRRYRKAAQRLETEIHELRNIPLAEERDLAEASSVEREGSAAGFLERTS